MLREYNGNDADEDYRDYVWRGRNLLARIERTSGTQGWIEETFHVATDHLGTPRAVTNSAGSVVESRRYYPFGAEITTMASSDRMQFTGHERDDWGTTSKADDFDYMHARSYNPQLARFLQVDPFMGWASEPQSLNRYAYVGGNPVNFIDPFGLVKECDVPNCEVKDEPIPYPPLPPPPPGPIPPKAPRRPNSPGERGDHRPNHDNEHEKPENPFEEKQVQQFFACLGESGQWGLGQNSREAGGSGAQRPDGTWYFAMAVGEHGEVKIPMLEGADLAGHTHPVGDVPGPSSNDRRVAEKAGIPFYVIHRSHGVTIWQTGDPPAGTNIAEPGWEQDYLPDPCAGLSISSP